MLRCVARLEYLVQIRDHVLLYCLHIIHEKRLVDYTLIFRSTAFPTDTAAYSLAGGRSTTTAKISRSVRRDTKIRRLTAPR